MTRIIVVGATSAIAQAVTRRLSSSGAHIALVGRNRERLDHVGKDLAGRGCAEVHTFVQDLDDLDRHSELVEQCWNSLGGCDVLLLAHGTLPDQTRCQDSVAAIMQALRTNALSAISLMTLFAGRFAAQGNGSIVVISSVAGDRGRRSNYVYGSAKAALSAFASGLRNRLADAGVHVMTVKPGLIDTPMTSAFAKGALWSTPEAAAKGIVSALNKRRDVAYIPWFWRPVMLAICALPERLFKRTNL